MRILMFLPSIEAEQNHAQKGCFELIDDLAYDLAGVVTTVKDEDGARYRGAPVYYLDNVDEKRADLLIFPKIYGPEGDYLAQFLAKLINEYKFPAGKVENDDFLVKKYLTAKYEDSPDEEIQASIKYWENHKLDVFNQYMAGCPDTFNEVFRDDKLNMPYILFETVEGKKQKMYYPRNSGFAMIEGKPYVVNILREQIPTSPHLYTTDKHKVDYGDIIIDAGVCEGNFSLRYAGVASKFYLFENDSSWFEALYHTFHEAGVDGEIIPKGVGSVSNHKTVKIDDAVRYAGEKANYFLKMDVDGFEQQALKGAAGLLRTGRVKSSICAYHKTDDEVRIKNTLKKYGYKISTSKGYMAFIVGADFWQNRDLRHGVVYGDI